MSELDNENGTLVYSTDMTNGAEVKVDAASGCLLSPTAMLTAKDSSEQMIPKPATGSRGHPSW
jgi:hypothetical protein